ncbi:MAG TPA: hypothetical protein VF950_12320 [Planctomycetota bacterium]
MLGWKKNKDCAICRQAIADDAPAFETPSAHFPGLGKPFGDFLEEDDPLQDMCRKRVHVECWKSWPERARFAAAWIGWKLDAVRVAPEQGEAWRGEQLALVAPADPDDPEARVRVFFLALAAVEEVPTSAWPAALAELAQKPLTREAMEGADALGRRFPDARSLTDAVDWARKPTPCQICQGILRANPHAPAVYRLPAPEFWPSDARALRSFAGALVHTDCYLKWPDRPRFLKAAVDVERRLAKLDAHRIVVPVSDTSFVTAGVDIELLAREARVKVDAAAWTAPAPARAFEKEAVDEALLALAARYPTPSALLASLDRTAKEMEAYQALADQIDQCHALVKAARGPGIRCPRCVARLNDLVHEEGAGTVECVRCGSELTPMDFGWLP